MSSVDLISLKIQILVGLVFFLKSEVQTLTARVKFFAIVFFSLLFHFVHKSWILKCKLPSIITGYIEIRWNLFNIPIFIDIQLVKEGIKDKRIFYVSILSFSWSIWKWEEKNLNFPNGDLNPRLLNKIPPTIWFLREIKAIELMVLKTSLLYYF